MALKPKLSAFLTGAAGGIAGCVISQLVDQFDGHLALADLDEAALRKQAARLARPGLTISTHAFDVSDSKQLKAAISEAADQAGGLDFLFNNAGMMTAPRAFEDLSDSDIERSISVNLNAVLIATRHAWPWLTASKGCVINISSGAGKIGLVSDPVYAAGKAGVIVFTRSNAMRRSETGIRFNVVCPGIVDTGILIDPRTGERRAELAGFMKDFHLIEPEEIANIVVRQLLDREANDEVVVVTNRKRAS